MLLPSLLENGLGDKIRNWLLNYPILHPIYSKAISKLEFFLKKEDNNCIRLIDLLNKYSKYIINDIESIYNNKEILNIIPSLENEKFWRNENELEKLLNNLLNQKNFQ